MTALAQKHEVHFDRGTLQGLVAAGASGLITLLAVAPCASSPHLLALPATGFVALMVFGLRRIRA